MSGDHRIERRLRDLRLVAPDVDGTLLRMLAVLLSSGVETEWLLLASACLAEDGRALVFSGRAEGASLLRLAALVDREAIKRQSD